MYWLHLIEASTAETLHNQLSGYGATLSIVQRTLDRSGVKDAMDTWEKETVKKVVDAFLDERFPTVIVSDPTVQQNLTLRMKHPQCL